LNAFSEILNKAVTSFIGNDAKPETKL